MGSVIYDTPGINVFTVPPGVKAFIVECWGGGGGGGADGGGGGGGSGYAKITVTGVLYGQTYNVYVGTAGTGGIAGGSEDGNDGEDSYYEDGSTCKAGGGKGGTSGNTTRLGGDGGLGISGSIVFDGGNGGNSTGGSLGGGGGGSADDGGDGGNGADDDGVNPGDGGAPGGTEGGRGGVGGDDSGSDLGDDGNPPGGGGGGGGDLSNGGAGGGGLVIISYTTGHVGFVTQPSNARANQSVGSLTVRVYYSDNTVDGNYDGEIDISINDDGGTGATLSGSTALFATAGEVIFTDLNLDKLYSKYTLYAATGVGDVLAAISSSFSITADRLTFTTQPSNTIINTSISPSVVVKGTDQYGTVDTSYSGSVTMGIHNNPAGGTLAGTNPISAILGVATFSNLSINNAGNPYSLIATNSPLLSGLSSSFQVIGGSAVTGRADFLLIGKSNAQGVRTLSANSQIISIDKVWDKSLLTEGGKAYVRATSNIWDRPAGSIRSNSSINATNKLNDRASLSIKIKNTIEDRANVFAFGFAGHRYSGISRIQGIVKLNADGAPFSPASPYVSQTIFPDSGIASFWSGSGLRIPQTDFLQDLTSSTGPNSIAVAVQDGTTMVTDSSFWTNENHVSKVFNSWFDLTFSPLAINPNIAYARMAYNLSAGAGVGVTVSGANLYFKKVNNPSLSSDVLFGSGITSNMVGNTSGIQKINFVVQSGNHALFPSVNGVLSMSGQLISTSSFSANSGVLQFIDLDIALSGSNTFNYFSLFIHGISSGTANMNLFVKGQTPSSGTSHFDMYTFATSAGVSGQYSALPLVVGFRNGTPDPRFSLPLYLNNSDVNHSVSSLNLFLRNDNSQTGQINLFVQNNFSTFNSGINLYTASPSGTEGAVPYSGQLNLYIGRNTEGLYGGVPMFVKVNESSNYTIPLYIKGANYSTSGINLYQKAIDSGTTNNVNLYTRGF